MIEEGSAMHMHRLYGQRVDRDERKSANANINMNMNMNMNRTVLQGQVLLEK